MRGANHKIRVKDAVRLTRHAQEWRIPEMAEWAGVVVSLFVTYDRRLYANVIWMRRTGHDHLSTDWRTINLFQEDVEDLERLDRTPALSVH